MKLSYSQLGSAFGISKQAVAALAKRGMPTDSVESARVWRAVNLDVSRVKVAPGASASGSDIVDGQDDAPVTGDDKSASDYRAARSEREQIKRDRERLELLKEQGRLVDVGEASRLAFTKFRQLRDALGNIGPAVAQDVAGKTDLVEIERIYAQALERVLNSVADSMTEEGFMRDEDMDEEAESA